MAGRPKLGSFLIEEGFITERQLEAAMEHQLESGCRLGEALIALGYCSEAAVARALAGQVEIPYVDLEYTTPSPACVALLPRDVALGFGALPIRMEGNRLLVAVKDPSDIRIDAIIRQTTGFHAVVAAAAPTQLWKLLEQHYSESFLEEAQALPVDEPQELELGDHLVSVEHLIQAGEQVSMVRLVHTLIADGVRRGASDVHLDPEPGHVRVRYRIDGWMHVAAVLPGEMQQSVVARIKIMCGMDIAENRKPQDGSCSVRVAGRPVELRAATLRGIHGEIVVLRLLGHDTGLQGLDALGFQPEMFREFRRLLAGRRGLILTTGPTGSGKTTTLYAALNYLNQERISIVTVEDPVESQLIGINQIQVHERAGRTFASTLRAILRQDPDIIMVGEIRDLETAEIACRAALTGHLVLSTLHTPDTLGTVERLREMGLAPWLLAACLNGVVAQRLARRVCAGCAAEYMPPVELQRAFETILGDPPGVRFRKGSGCPACNNTGCRGRVGVYELLTVDERLRHLLAMGAPREELRAYVHQRGFTTLEQDAFQKACQGLTSPEEVVELGMGVAMSLDETEPVVAEMGEEAMVTPEL